MRDLLILGALLMCLTVTVIPAAAQRSSHDDEYALKALRIEGTHLEIVRLGVKTGSVWILKQDEWIRLAPPKALSLSVYECELVPVGKKSWILILMDTATGDSYIYASATQGWRFAGEATE